MKWWVKAPVGAPEPDKKGSSSRSRKWITALEEIKTTQPVQEVQTSSISFWQSKKMSLYPTLTEEIAVRTADEESEDVTIGKKTCFKDKNDKINHKKQSKTVLISTANPRWLRRSHICPLKCSNRDWFSNYFCWRFPPRPCSQIQLAKNRSWSKVRNNLRLILCYNTVFQYFCAALWSGNVLYRRASRPNRRDGLPLAVKAY